MDIPEFYELAAELFLPEEAEVAAAMPRKPSPALVVAQEMGREETQVLPVLEAMADKGLCSTFTANGRTHYVAVPFVPGIFEFQFMKGTSTDRDRRMARLIHAYKEAVDRKIGHPPITFPTFRSIPVEKTIHADSRVNTFDQVSSYIDQYDPIAVSTCFCRHEGNLVDESKDCGKPNDVCMQFGAGAQYVIERGMGRKVTKEEALRTLQRAEEAGLVHASMNTQEIDFLCNCCACHCVILKTALAQPKPGRVLYSGFRPEFDADRCVQCETCIERCPAAALAMREDLPRVDPDRCFGCGVCATGCPSEAIQMVETPDFQDPPVDRKALKAALAAAKAH
jgi:Pyruvate/2-oxoacid:ferredoxin oxidoreductase delta subunit